MQDDVRLEGRIWTMLLGQAGLAGMLEGLRWSRGDLAGEDQGRSEETVA